MSRIRPSPQAPHSRQALIVRPRHPLAAQAARARRDAQLESTGSVIKEAYSLAWWHGVLIALGSFCLLFGLKSVFETPAASLTAPIPIQKPAIEPLPPLREASEPEPSVSAFPDPARPVLPITPRTHWVSVTVQAGDTLGHLFAKWGLSSRELQTILQLGTRALPVTRLQVGQRIRLEIRGQSLLQLRLDVSPIHEWVLTKSGDTYTVTQYNKPFTLAHRFIAGTIRSSLFADAQRAGLEDKLIVQLAEIFAWDIDFALDVQPGDQFHVLYETYQVEGQPTAAGHILAAEYRTAKQVYRAVRYVNPDGQPSYFTPDGVGLRKAFLRTPVKFTRISSYFTAARHHPILHKLRAHKGVDYAAPLGTPVKSAGRGKVQFAGWMNGYGNVVILQHGTRYSTLYGHLSHFVTGLKTGQAVQQGQVIGFVGSTGLATAPHLHYEFRVNGIHQNPLTVTLPREIPEHKQWRQRFLRHADLLMTELRKQQALLG